MQTTNDIRKAFLNYFAGHGHEVVALEPPGAAQRPDADVRQRRHGPVQERLHRRRDAPLPARRDLPEVRARRRQAQRPGERRPHGAPPHLFRDARQLLLRRLLQGRGHRARLEPADQGVRPARRASAGHGLRRGRRGLRAVAQDRRPARVPGPAYPDVGQLLGHGRHRAVRAVLGDLLRSRRARRRRPARLGGRGRRPLHRDLEPGVHAVRAGDAGKARRSAQALRRHGAGAGAHRRRPAGHPRQLRDRSLPGAHRRLGRGRGHGCARQAQGVAPGHRRPPARRQLPHRRRRAAVERGARLRAAPHHAPRHAPRPAHGLRRAPAVAAGPHVGGADGPGLSRTGARPGPHRRDPEAGGGPLQGDPGARPRAPRRGHGRPARRCRTRRRDRLQALRHLRLPPRPDRGRAQGQWHDCRQRRLRCRHGAPARRGAPGLGRLRRGGDRGGLVLHPRGPGGDRVSRLRDRVRRGPGPGPGRRRRPRRCGRGRPRRRRRR